MKKKITQTVCPPKMGSKLAISNQEVELGVTLVTSSSTKSTDNCGLVNQRQEMASL